MAKARETRRAVRGSMGPFLLVLAALAAACGGAPVQEPAQKPPAQKPQQPKKGPGGAQKPGGPQQGRPQAGAPAKGAAGRESLSPPGLAAPDGVLGQMRNSDGKSDRELSDHYLRVGKQHFDRLEYTKAYENLRRAVELDPANLEATRLYYEAGALIGVRQDELKTQLERLREAQTVKIQLMRQEMIRFYEAGEKAFNAKDFDQAIKDLERVLQIIAYSEVQIDPAQGDTSFKKRAEKLIAESKSQRVRAELERRQKLEDEMVKRTTQEQDRKRQQDERRIENMLQQASDLLQAKRFDQAEELAERVLQLAPGHPIAVRTRDLARAGREIMADERIFTTTNDEEWQDGFSQKAVTTPREGRVIDFPADWRERTKGRKPGLGNATKEDPVWVTRYRNILRERPVSTPFDNHTLRDVVIYLQDLSGLNIVLAPGIDADSLTVSVRLTDISLENAIKIILDQVGLTYYFDKESIIIDEPGKHVGDVEFEIYDVSDILFSIPDFKGPRMRLPDPDNAQGAGGAGGGGSLVFGGDDEGTAEPLTGESLGEIVKGATGGDEVWADPLTIEAHRGQLLVTAPPEIHQQVLDVLDNLRQNQGWFVHIETRFIDVRDDTLQDVGVDFRGLGGNPGDERSVRGTANPNTTFPLGTPVDIEQPFRDVGGTDAGSLNASANPAGGNGRNFGPGLDGVASRTQHIFGNTPGPAFGRRLGGGGGLTLQMTRLDPFQYNAILRAEFESARVKQLTAPRVTAANRERVYVSVVTQRAYIADWELVSGGTGLSVVEVPDPVIETLQEGVVLEVRPTISADRKYVTLDCRPSLATLVGGQIRTQTINLGSVSMTALQVPIGLPEIRLDEAFTSVTIPDGGMALLGGFREIDETDDVSSLPFLDSIPLVNVLFRRQAEVRETRSLVILVTAKIISIRNEERKRFNRSE